MIVGLIDNCAMSVWCDYYKAISRMELRGIPIDYNTIQLLLRSRWALCDILIVQVNKIGLSTRTGYLIVLDFLSGDDCGVAWPRTKDKITGKFKLSLKDEIMESMEGLDPFIALVRQTRKTINAFKRKLSINIDGVTRRHYFNTSPFRSITGRNQPTRFIFGAPKWMRWLIGPPKNCVLIYVDYHCQEIAIAAHLSRDPVMRDMYADNDAHMWFAIKAGAASV